MNRIAVYLPCCKRRVILPALKAWASEQRKRTCRGCGTAHTILITPKQSEVTGRIWNAIKFHVPSDGGEPRMPPDHKHDKSR